MTINEQTNGNVKVSFGALQAQFDKLNAATQQKIKDFYLPDELKNKNRFTGDF